MIDFRKLGSDNVLTQAKDSNDRWKEQFNIIEDIQ